MKQCSSCKEVKPLDEFHKHPRCSQGVQSHCKECQAAERDARRGKARKLKRKPRMKKHICNFRFGFCIKCRQIEKRKQFERVGYPIFCKSGRIMPQASRARA